MTAPVSQVLSEAADLLEKPGAWTRETYARDHKGQSVSPNDPSQGAVCFCALGAIEKVNGGHFSDRDADLYLRRALEDDTSFSTPKVVGGWNDSPDRTQPEVVDALRRAAALAKEQGR